ncbi:putative ankyrin repeat protein RF_0381 [Physella acuta]|uniref:putative ankyrin repeat protein RF_0381 n=1 Tax=Physella acuta TaxID=109671 RepID=UPI0027DE6149|nr:putative ankyrin repeat protein RF_0381 [Physella acuta]
MKEFNSFNVPDKILQPRLTQNRINKSLEILKILLAHEFDVNIRDNYRKTALHYSVEYEQLEFTHMLLEAGADVNLLDDNHDTPLVIACRLYLNLQKINELGDFGGSSLDISHYKGLMTSTKKMRSRLNYLAKMVESLITPDARVNIADKDGYTALHLAAETDNVQIVQRLLGAGGDVRVAANTGETVLHCAARSSCSEIMDILLSEPQSADAINARMTELFERSNKRLKRFHGHEQVYNSRVHQVDYLDHNNKRSQVCLNTLSGKTALIVALENSNEQTALKLLSRHPDLKVHTDEGYTALHFAAFESCTDVVRHMLQAGCNVNVQTEEGHTPLMLAGNKEIALLLCDAGADVNLVDKNGDKALHLAIYRSEADVAQVLINKGTVIDGNFPEPLPPLVLAAALNAITIVKMLLKAGANVNVLSSSGISPLMAAAACDSSGYNNAEIFQILNEHGADFNMTGKKGRTALMYLVKRGNPQLHLGTFLFYGADLNIEDDDNRSALTYHLLEDESKFQISLIKLLLKSGQNPLVDVKYRYLLQKHKLLLHEAQFFYFVFFLSYPMGSSFIFPEDSCYLLQLHVCNGVVLKHSYNLQPTSEINTFTALMLSIHFGNLELIKYLLATCYMTVQDLRQLRQVDQSTTGAYNTRLEPELLNVITAAVSEPWPLVKLAFITVSTMLGESPEREERLSQTNLPPQMKQLLMFQSPVSFLPVDDWCKISLCYDPVDYETLPRPRPLMYHWPMGINLVS